MSKTALYNLIKKTSDIRSDLPPISAHKHGKTNVDFYLINLLQSEITIGDYSLTKHHISLFESPLGPLDHKSQYHYTAFFSDKSDKKYRLHVFFDEKDRIIGTPQLCEMVGDEFIPVPCEDYLQDFGDVAQENSANPINKIRQTQNSIVQEMWEKYKKLEERQTVHSLNLGANKKVFLTILAQQIKLLNEIKLYSNSNPELARIIKCLEKQQQYIDVVEVKSEPEQVTETPHESGQQLKLFKHEKKEPVVIKRRNLSEALTPLQLQMDVLQELSNEEKAKKLETLLADVRMLEWEVDAHSYTASAVSIRELEIFRKKIEKSGVVFLQNLLINRKVVDRFSLAEKLPSFYYLLQPDIVNLALMINDYQLVDFLLKHKLLAAEEQKFSIKDKSYSSLVSYCFKHANEPRIIELFSVILNYEPSLNEMDNDTKLPFCAVLLFTPGHPLHQVWLSHQADHQNSKQALRSCLNKPQISPERKEQIRKRIENLEAKGNFEDDDALQLQVCKKYGAELFRKIQNDPDLIRVKEEGNALLVALAEILPKRKLEYFENCMNLQLDQTNQELKVSLTQEDKIPPVFEEIKSDHLRRLIMNRDMLYLSIDFETVKQKIEGMSNKVRRYPRNKSFQTTLIQLESQYLEIMKSLLEKKKLFELIMTNINAGSAHRDLRPPAKQESDQTLQGSTSSTASGPG